MTMRIYQSTDSGAPTLQGIVGGTYSSGWADGSLVELLRKCLVVGYGSQTAAGWTLSYTGTSKGSFKQGGGCGFYIRVLDDGSLTAGAREAQFSGFETMSDVDTGTGEFPTNAQQSTRLKFRKSNAASSTQRSWIMMADNKTFRLFSWYNQGDGGTDTLGVMEFGDIYSFRSGDAYNCIAIGRVTSATLDTTGNELWGRFAGSTSQMTDSPGHYMARGYSQSGASIGVSKAASLFLQISGNVTQVLGNLTGLAFPNPADSKVLLSRIYVLDNTSVPSSTARGYLRGVWNPQHTAATVMPREYTFSGVGNLAGRTFKLLGLPTVGSSGVACVETSDTWD